MLLFLLQTDSPEVACELAEERSRFSPYCMCGGGGPYSSIELAAAAAAAAAIRGDPGARNGTADWRPAAAVRAAAMVGSRAAAAGSGRDTAAGRDDDDDGRGAGPVDDAVALPLIAVDNASRQPSLIVGSVT